MNLRSYLPHDLPIVVQLFHDTIHSVNLGDYSQTQVDAWAPSAPDLARWGQKLGSEEVILAEENSLLVGFCAWTTNGYLDFLFVHRSHQRMGIATALYLGAEKRLRAAKLANVRTHASVTAQPFFLRQGFRVVRHQRVKIRGVDLPNAIMEKELV